MAVTPLDGEPLAATLVVLNQGVKVADQRSASLTVEVPRSSPRTDAQSVAPLQLGVHTLEAVRNQLLLVPGLSDAGRLPASGLRIHDHDLRLEYRRPQGCGSAPHGG